MSDTTFVPRRTVIASAWAQDVNDAIYFRYDRTYTGGLGALIQQKGIVMTQPPFSCDKTGVADCSTAINLALTTYPGVPLHFPKGTYRCDSTLSIKPAPSWGVFGPGARITGDGVGSTFFDNRVASGPLFDIDSDSHGGAYHANMGTVLYGFQIMTTTSPAASIGIRVLNGYQIDIEQLVIKGMTYYGIELKNGAYSDDGWNRVFIRNTWIEGCLVWGIKADGSTNRNEGSYTYLEGVFFQSNGTAGSANPPTSGGMIWKGQVLVMESGGAANGNQQCALYIKGDSGLGQTVDLRNWTSENTYGWGIYCSGVHAFKARLCQFYNNTVFTCDTMVEFNGGAGYDINQVEFDGCTVRNAGLNMTGSVTGTVLTITAVAAGVEQNIVVGSRIYGTGVTAGTYVTSLGTGTGGIGTYNLSASSAATGSINIKGHATTAFKISGANAQLDRARVRNTNWENFDFPDQVRFNGWRHDFVQAQCELAVASSTSVVVRPKSNLPNATGATMPLRLAGGRGGSPSKVGELVAVHIPASGVGAGLGGLPASATRYYCYLWDSLGTVSLELSTTVPVQDSDTGLFIKTGDASRIYVGSIATDATPLFLTANTGWLNPTPIAGSQVGTYAWMWYSGTSGALRRTLATLPTSDTDGALV